MELQHDYHHAIISTMHIHLNHQQCLEILVVRGKVKQLRELQQRIQVLKGVGYAELSVTHVDEHREHEHHS
jgi:CopG family nickel-responsive transcriptional regulator